MHVMMSYNGVGPYLHSFLTSGLDEGEWTASRLGRFFLDKEFQYPLNMRLSGTQIRAQSFRNKKVVSLLGFKFRTCYPHA